MIRPAATVADVVEFVADHYDLRARTLRYGARTDRAVSRPRHLAMFLASTVLGMSQSAIGRAFGGMDHSSVASAVAGVTARLRDSAQLRSDIDRIMRRMEIQAQLAVFQLRRKVVNSAKTGVPVNNPEAPGDA
jgi:chromosomal replication initiator protein